jgi:DNA-binding PadR family transcriptional regulator
MERTSLYRTIAPIEDHGWVSITPGTRGRTKDASITPAGRDALRRATSAWEETQKDIVGAIGAPAWQALEQQLSRLVDTTRGKTF